MDPIKKAPTIHSKTIENLSIWNILNLIHQLLVSNQTEHSDDKADEMDATTKFLLKNNRCQRLSPKFNQNISKRAM